MENTVALSSLGVVATVVACLAWVVKYVLTQVKTSLDSHVDAANKIAKSTDANTKAIKSLSRNSEQTGKTVKELNEFMVNLNGSLRKVVQEKQAKAKE